MFDLFVVSMSLVALGPLDMPISVIRLMRAFRFVDHEHETIKDYTIHMVFAESSAFCRWGMKYTLGNHHFNVRCVSIQLIKGLVE